MQIEHAHGARSPSPPRALAQLADRQHGTVARWQLLALGFTRRVIARLIRDGWLHPIHHGVYAVGHGRLTVRGRWMAAVLACGPAAVLSHDAAAALWELRTAPTTIDVTAPGKRRHPTVRCHVTRARPPWTTIDAIPVTTLERTLIDQAGRLSLQRVRSMLESAQRRDLLDIARMHATIAASPGRDIKRLRHALAQLHDEAPWTQSELERAFLELIRAAGLPEPQCNVYVAGVLVDFYWPEQRVVIEIDGYAYHRSRRSFEQDRRNSTRLQVAGVRAAIQVTADRIRHDQRGLIADMQQLLIGSAAA
jgi:very-short-patch-repair endonuclease